MLGKLYICSNVLIVSVYYFYVWISWFTKYVCLFTRVCLLQSASYILSFLFFFFCVWPLSLHVVFVFSAIITIFIVSRVYVFSSIAFVILFILYRALQNVVVQLWWDNHLQNVDMFIFMVTTALSCLRLDDALNLRELLKI